MTEDIRRALLSAVRDELDRRIAGLVGQTARKVILSTTLGAGLALAGCSDNGETTKQDSGLKPDSAITDGSTTDSAVGDSAVPTDNGIEEDSAASDSTKPQADMALTDGALDATLQDAGNNSDLGSVPLYAMPVPDSGPAPAYMAPPSQSEVD